MDYTLHENLSDLKGTVSNLHGFIHRDLDTGFSSKWSGYWSPSYKFLDYYGIKVNGIWLDGNTLQATEYGEKTVYHHNTDVLDITEVVSTPSGLPGFRLELHFKNLSESKKAVQAGLELGVDIRERAQDIGPGGYEVETGKTWLSVVSGERKLMVKSEDSFEIAGSGYTKEHFPGERQLCFIPGQVVFQKEVGPGEEETVEIEFTTSKASFRSLDEKEQRLDHELGRGFNQGIKSLKNLVYDRDGLGIIAGHPWFQNYWARDTFWSVLGLIDAGYFEASEEILENFADRGIPGKINLEGDDEEMERSDTEPLFIIATEKLRKHYGLSQTLQDAREKAMEELEMDENGVVEHSSSGTWMDTLERDKAVDIQSLWLEAAEIIEDSGKELLEKGLGKFETSDGLEDVLDGGADTINPAVPLMFGQVSKKAADKQLEKINAEFSSRYGARTRSMVDPGYSSSGYHTGSVWGLTTGWAAAANFEYDKPQQGVNFLEKMESLLDTGQPGSFPEVVDAESGDSLGCPEQAWSAGMMVHVIDSYLLGIKPEENSVTVDPSGNVNGKRSGKRIGEHVLDLEFENGTPQLVNAEPEVEAINTENGKLRIEF